MVFAFRIEDGNYLFLCISKLLHYKSTAFFFTVKKKVRFSFAGLCKDVARNVSTGELIVRKTHPIPPSTTIPA